MSEKRSTTGTYALGHAPREIQSLQVQSQLLKAFTRRLFEDAGITAGMRVLEVGCGAGDVSLLAAGGVARLPALVSAWTRRA